MAVTAFIDVNVVPMDTERVLANYTVVVAGGRITALGPSSKVQVPAGAVRVDGRGQYLMPGLGAMHDHETFFKEQDPDLFHNMARNLADGVTAIGSHTSPLMGQIQTIRRLLATIPSPRLYAGQRLTLWNPESMAARVAASKAAGYDHFVTHAYDRGSDSSTLQRRASYDSLLAAARRVGLPVTLHHHNPPFEALLALGLAGGSADHLYAIYQDSIGSGDTWQQLPPDLLTQKMQRLATAVQQAGVWITPTLVCVVGAPPFSPSDRYKLRFTKILQDAGVRLLLARDDFWDVHDDLKVMVEAGLSPYQALVTGTRNIAEYFNRLDELGTVVVGKRADLVLLRGNPLADVAYAREPIGVMIDGQWLDRAALDQGLLAAPKSWLRWFLRKRGNAIAPIGGLGGKSGEEQRAKLTALIDSLELAKPKRADYERLLRRFAVELGALRALVPPEQQREWLDPSARAWMREQARQGYEVVVPKVSSAP